MMPPIPRRTPSLYVIGDVHGEHVQLMSLLLGVGIVDDDLHWTAGQAQLWFLGDFVDRGPDGIGTIDLVMRLEDAAAQAGGRVGALLGNHDLLLLMAHRFGDRAGSEVTGLTFLGEWLQGGGKRGDLSALTSNRVDWFTRRPAMALVANRLLVHCDSLWYTEYGLSIADVNAAVNAVLASDDPVEWERLLGSMSTRFAFDEAHGGSAKAAQSLLDTFGGQQVIHGHTPITSMDGRHPGDVNDALIYAAGLAVNVDGAMYLGGAGIVLSVESATRPTGPALT